MTLQEQVNAPRIERRASTRKDSNALVPYVCAVRMCLPSGATCQDCGRVVYPANWIKVQPVSL